MALTTDWLNPTRRPLERCRRGTGSGRNSGGLSSGLRVGRATMETSRID